MAAYHAIIFTDLHLRRCRTRTRLVSTAPHNYTYTNQASSSCTTYCRTNLFGDAEADSAHDEENLRDGGCSKSVKECATSDNILIPSISSATTPLTHV